MHASHFVLTTTGRLFDTQRLPRGASEYDFEALRWVVPVGISGQEIMGGRHISADEAARLTKARRNH